MNAFGFSYWFVFDGYGYILKTLSLFNPQQGE